MTTHHNLFLRLASLRWVRTLVSCSIILGMLPIWSIPASVAYAAACAPTAVVITDNVSATSAAGPLTFYEDTGINPSLRGMYVGYTITNNAATTSADLWVKLDTFSQARIGLGLNEDGIQHLGPLAPGASAQVYFYLTDPSGSGDVAALNETFQVNLYSGHPSLTAETCDFTDTIWGIDDNIQAQANKIMTSVAGPNPASIGGVMTMSVVGETGTMGGTQQFSLAAATYPDWPANAYQLADVQTDFWQGTPCPNPPGSIPPGAPTNTYADKLVFSPADTTNSCYKVLYTFIATGATSAPTTVSPINNISSGNQVKHTGGYETTLLPIQPASNTTTLSKSVSPTVLPVGGVANYTVTLLNTGTSAITLDLLRDILPASATYVAGTSQYNGSAITNPYTATSGSVQTLTWTGLFTVPAGASRTLTYSVTIPSTLGAYTNSVIGKIESVQIDTTLALADNAPATATVQVGAQPDLTVIKSHSGNFTVGSNGTYTLTVSNSGIGSTSGTITVVDTLPAGLALVAASSGNATWSCAAGPGVGQVSCTSAASIAAGTNSSFPLVVSVAAAAVPSATNVASVSGGGEPAGNTGNNSTSDPTTVNPPAAPVAANDSANTTGTTPAALAPANNDTAGGNGASLVPGSIDLDPATAGQQTSLSTAQGSWALNTTTGVVTFTAIAGYSGAATIPYTVKDNFNQTSNLANLTVTVSAPSTPVANPDSTNTIGTNPATLTPASNDAAGGNGASLVPGSIDLDPAAAGQQTSLSTAEGTWTLDSATGQVTFLPAVGFSGAASVSYTIQDSYGQTSNAANLTVTVSPPSAPVANPDSTTTTGANPATLTPASNDTAGGSGAILLPSTIDLDPATAGQQTSLTTAEGTWALDSATGQVTFVALPGFSGASTTPYTIQDNYGSTSAAADLTVNVSVPAGLAANPDTTATIGTNPATLTPASNDTAGGNGASLVPGSIDLDPATTGQQTSLTTAEGTWTLNTTTGAVTFTAVIGFSGAATIPYTIQDNYGTLSNAAILAVAVSAPAAPVANPDSTSTTGTSPAALTPASNDTAGGSGAILLPSTIDLDPASAGQQTSLTTAEGTWTLDSTTGVVTFTAVAGFTGTATIPYTIQDSYGTPSNAAILAVAVSAPAAPVANPDSTSTIGTNPATLTPASNDAAGGNGASLVPSTIDLDPASAGQQATLVTALGSWALDMATGQVTFIAVAGFSGTATISYTISDNYGQTSNSASLAVTVSVPTNPVANNDSTSTTGTNSATLIPVSNDLAGGNGAALDKSTIDLDPASAGQQLTLTTAQGSWSLDPTTGQVTFTAAPGFSGGATASYTITDNYGQLTNIASLTVTVGPPAAPSAANDNASTTGIVAVTLMPASNDTAASGAALLPSTIDLDPATPGQQTSLTTAQGSWVLDPSTGQVTFTALSGVTGPVSIPYTIEDSYGQVSNGATLNVIVTMPPLPIANNDNVVAGGAGPITVTPVSNDTVGAGAALVPSTIDLDPLTPGQQTSLTTAQGTWTLDPTTGQVTFTPAPGFTGTATIPYTVQDTYGQTSAPGNISIVVSAATAVTLRSFTATWHGGVVIIQWQTLAEMNSLGFRIYRGSSEQRPDAVEVTPALIMSQGRGQEGASYTWTDTSAEPGQHYSYWLVEVEINGRTNEYGMARATTAATMQTIYLPMLMH